MALLPPKRLFSNWSMMGWFGGEVRLDVAHLRHGASRGALDLWLALEKNRNWAGLAPGVLGVRSVRWTGVDWGSGSVGFVPHPVALSNTSLHPNIGEDRCELKPLMNNCRVYIQKPLRIY